jgi:NAD(P)-dependent dehydrogenase (short-subunit alcohol dehydrogenase family)
MQELGGKVAVVTGGASGIGLALAEAFVAEGMGVVLADIEAGPLDEAAAKLSAGGAEVLAVRTDVRHYDEVEALAQATVDRFGAVHVVCNNAGVVAGGLSWEVSPERFRWVVEVNLLGVAHGIRAFVPRLIAQGEGHVVNTASAAGLITGPGMASYFATKHGVVALTEALANELVLDGHGAIGTSVLCPEFVRTRIHEAERNLPAEIAPAPVDGAGTAEGRQMFAAMVVEGGIEPSTVADAVVEAVKADRFYVLPHDTTLDLARKRWSKIEANQRPFLWE